MDRQIGGQPHRAAAERVLRRSLGEPIELTEQEIEEVARLEKLYGEWQRAGGVKSAASALHRAAVGVDPLAADIWAPRALRRRRSLRVDFLRTLQLLWRARERGQLHDELTDEAMVLLCRDLARQSAVAAAAPTRGARRCEGRNRAPQGSAGGPRVGSGGSRRGGDRGDDSGGGGSDGPGGGPSGPGHSRRQFDWPALGGLCGVVSTLLAAASFVFGPLHSAPVTQKVIIREVHVLAPPPSAAKAGSSRRSGPVSRSSPPARR